jgi:ADP-heptose:LPS heptosyltransferase
LQGLIPSGNLLVILFNGYGDAFLALPALREICRRYSEQKVTLVCYAEQIKTIFHGLNLRFVTGVITDGCLHITPCLGELDFQQIVSFNAYYPNPIEQELAQHFGEKPRWGFCDKNGRPDEALSRTASHMRDQYFQILGWPTTYTLADRQLTIPEAAFGQARQLIREWARACGDFYYALHTDSLPDKMWPLEFWEELGTHIWSRWRAWPIILGEENDQASALTRILPFARKLPEAVGISAHFAAVWLARGFIGIDSIFAHVADSYEKAMIVLFGPSDARLWGPVGVNALVINPQSGDRMSEIAVARVIEAADHLFRRIRLDEVGAAKYSFD